MSSPKYRIPIMSIEDTLLGIKANSKFRELFEFLQEEISGGRIIVGGSKVYDKSQIVKVNLKDGSINAEDDYLESTNEY